MFHSLYKLRSIRRTFLIKLRNARFDDYDHKHRIFQGCFYQGISSWKRSILPGLRLLPKCTNEVMARTKIHLRNCQIILRWLPNEQLERPKRKRILHSKSISTQNFQVSWTIKSKKVQTVQYQWAWWWSYKSKQHWNNSTSHNIKQGTNIQQWKCWFQHNRDQLKCYKPLMTKDWKDGRLSCNLNIQWHRKDKILMETSRLFQDFPHVIRNPNINIFLHPFLLVVFRFFIWKSWKH